MIQLKIYLGNSNTGKTWLAKRDEFGHFIDFDWFMWNEGPQKLLHVVKEHLKSRHVVLDGWVGNNETLNEFKELYKDKIKFVYVHHKNEQPEQTYLQYISDCDNEVIQNDIK